MKKQLGFVVVALALLLSASPARASATDSDVADSNAVAGYFDIFNAYAALANNGAFSNISNYYLMLDLYYVGVAAAITIDGAYNGYFDYTGKYDATFYQSGNSHSSTLTSPTGVTYQEDMLVGAALAYEAELLTIFLYVNAPDNTLLAVFFDFQAAHNAAYAAYINMD